MCEIIEASAHGGREVLASLYRRPGRPVEGVRSTLKFLKHFQAASCFALGAGRAYDAKQGNKKVRNGTGGA